MRYFIERLSPMLWRVSNDEEGEVYVSFNGKYLICECSYFRKKHFCKHERLVVYSLITGKCIMEEEDE
jgi:hypothetical protein